MADRYFSAEPIEGTSATLSGSEAHHLLHVMRAQPGDSITLFDGQGGEFEAEVTRCGRAEVELALGPRLEVERELAFRVTLATALPKGDRQRWLVEKAVELGVTEFIPLQSARSQGSKSESPAKLLRYVIEASKQCGRNRLMQIATPTTFTEVLNIDAERRLVAHPGGERLDAFPENQHALLLVVGPEGGFTEEEITQAKNAGWQTAGLGERILRVETAALALLARLVLGS